jgi:hypothetical protein
MFDGGVETDMGTFFLLGGVKIYAVALYFCARTLSFSDFGQNSMDRPPLFLNSEVQSPPPKVH